MPMLRNVPSGVGLSNKKFTDSACNVSITRIQLVSNSEVVANVRKLLSAVWYMCMTRTYSKSTHVNRVTDRRVRKRLRIFSEGFRFTMFLMSVRKIPPK